MLGLGPDGHRHERTWGRLVAAATVLLGGGLGLAALLPAGPAAGAGFNPYNLTFPQKWTTGALADQGLPIAESSPMVATLDANGPSVVVGDRAGHLYAYHLATGTAVAGWPVSDGGPGIDSTPSVAQLGDSLYDTVFVGTGYAAQSKRGGGYEAFSADGIPLWETSAPNPIYDRANSASGVQASLTVTDLQGNTAVFAGSMGQEAYALDATDGATVSGFPFFNSDTVFSTAAAADLYGTGQADLIASAGQTAGLAFGQHYSNGGHLRILNSHGGLVCDYDTDQEVDSSPAVGEFLPDGQVGIVMGTGNFFAQASDTDVLDAFNSECGLAWSDKLDGVTSSSPALADLDGTGQLDVVEGTQTGTNAGSVWAVDGATGSVLWRASVGGPVIGGVVTADLTGLGYQDVLAPTTHGVYVLDGRSGSLVKVLAPLFGFQNSPLVTDDPNGTIGVTLAGYNGSNHGDIIHYEIPGSNGALAVSAGSWPMFHHDPGLSGVAGPMPAPGSIPRCQIPSAAVEGYDLASSDGGVFTFGEPFCGTASTLRASAPMVGMAMARGIGGYWLVFSDGTVDAFGQAQDYGSLSGTPLAAPIVGIAATPDGKGYWMVGADGDVYAFGDAHYYGSLVGRHLSKPVVGMAVDPDGLGYRLAAADGGVFCFGDAVFEGALAGSHLSSPVVGIASDWATSGYWLVQANGTVTSYSTPFAGPGTSLKLNQPVVGMAATADARGYWLVARDGGVFGFGDAPFEGSMGSKRLAAPVDSMAGFSG